MREDFIARAIHGVLREVWEPDPVTAGKLPPDGARPEASGFEPHGFPLRQNGSVDTNTVFLPFLVLFFFFIISFTTIKKLNVLLKAPL